MSDSSSAPGMALPVRAWPDEFGRLHDLVVPLFATVRAWFSIPDAWSFSLASVDEPVTGDVRATAAFTLRHLQAVRTITHPLTGEPPLDVALGYLRFASRSLDVLLAHRMADPAPVIVVTDGVLEPDAFELAIVDITRAATELSRMALDGPCALRTPARVPRR